MFDRCFRCDKVFWSQHDLMYHLNQDHQRDIQVREVDELAQSPTTAPAQTNLYDRRRLSQRGMIE